MDPQAAHHYLRHALGFLFITYIVSALIFIIPVLQTVRKAGLHFTISLLPLIPGIGTVLAMYIIAFSAWKTPTA
jgi:ATP/ADP translocase